MKKFSIISLVLITGLLLVFTQTTAYIPEDGFVEGLIFSDAVDRTEVVQNTIVNFSIIVKNLTNDTAGNFTINQDIPAGVQLVSLSDIPFEGDTLALVDTEITDIISGNKYEVSYLNMTNSNFSLNVDITIHPGNNFGVQFSANMTDDGQIPFTQPRITYYDHWGDRYQGRDNSALILNFQIQPLPPSSTTFIPQFKTTEPNYTLLLGLLIGLFIVVILARGLYLKPPIQI